MWPLFKIFRGGENISKKMFSVFGVETPEWSLFIYRRPVVAQILKINIFELFLKKVCFDNLKYIHGLPFRFFELI